MFKKPYTFKVFFRLDYKFIYVKYTINYKYKILSSCSSDGKQESIEAAFPFGMAKLIRCLN